MCLCKICNELFCPPACPSYRGISPQYGKPRGRCGLCGDYIYNGDIYGMENGILLCAQCAEAYE